MILRSGIIYASIFLLFSILITYSGISLSYKGIYATGFSIFLYQFGINTLGTFMWLQTLKNERIIDPAKIIFTEDSGFVLPVSWFMNTGMYTMFLDIPPIVFYYYFNRNLDEVLLQMIWGATCIILGFSIGSALSIISQKGNWSGSIGSGIFNSIRMVGLIGIFILFDITVFFPRYIFIFSFSVRYPLDYMFPVLDIGFIAFTNHVNIDSIIASFSWSFFYLIISVYIAYFLSRHILDNIFERKAKSQWRKSKRWSNKKNFGPVLSLTFKDLKIATRDVTNLSSFFFPVFFSLPALLEVFVDKRFGDFPPLYTYVAIFILTSLSVSFYSIQSLVMEGKNFINLRTWLISKNEIIVSKTFSSLIIFIFFAIPIAIVMIGANFGDIFYAVLIILDASMAFFFSSLVTLSFILSKIPEETTSINVYSFGGIFGLVLIFLISIISGAFAPLLSFTLGAILEIPGIDFPSIFLGIILLISLILARITLTIMSKGDKSKT